ncbi:hypothetical protein QE152_g22326 [Popillia japonica]|uniref:C2H2-type domain-containing protein n=1 Tax=Popillia japonica TaxID=7064 RepID=A0AAW1KLB3_POPJA
MESRPARKDYNKLTGDDQHLLQDKEDIHQETSQQSQNEDVKNKHEKLDNETIFRDELTNNELIETDSESTFTDIDLDRDDFTDDSDYDEALTCNVCDRSFASPKQLSSHKQKKRHFGCSACDSLFPSLMALEHHKEEFEHWSGDEDVTCTDSEDDEDETVVTEECERLL